MPVAFSFRSSQTAFFQLKSWSRETQQELAYLLLWLTEEFAPFGGFGHFKEWFETMPWALYEISNPVS